MVDPSAEVNPFVAEFKAKKQKIRDDVFVNCTEVEKAIMILHLLGFAAQQIIETGIVCNNIYLFISIGLEISEADMGLNQHSVNILRNVCHNTSKVMSLYLTDLTNANIAAQEIFSSLRVFYSQIRETPNYTDFLRDTIKRVEHLRN